MKYLQTALQEFKYQVFLCLLLTHHDNYWPLLNSSKLEDSEKARLQLEEIDRGNNVAELEANLKKKEAELKRIKAAEKARVSLLRAGAYILQDFPLIGL